MYDVIVSPEAEADLERIIRYIAVDPERIRAAIADCADGKKNYHVHENGRAMTR